jgi:hypothetical protein
VGYIPAGAGQNCLGELTLAATSGTWRQGQSKYGYMESSVYYPSLVYVVWQSTANITSIAMRATKTNIVGVGSYIELWKLAQ